MLNITINKMNNEYPNLASLDIINDEEMRLYNKITSINTNTNTETDLRINDNFNT